MCVCVRARVYDCVCVWVGGWVGAGAGESGGCERTRVCCCVCAFVYACLCERECLWVTECACMYVLDSTVCV
jgi:hypothetical protein